MRRAHGKSADAGRRMRSSGIAARIERGERMERTRTVAQGIRLIDTFMSDMQGFTAVYALRGEKAAALVDSGVASSVDAVLRGLEEAGIEREEVAWVVATHIHIDHAGGAGYLLEQLPNARVVVARRGVETLADPTRLMASARRALGGIADLYGDMAPIAEDRIIAAEDLEGMDLGGRILRLVHTPGHAATHICVVDEETRTLFSGDALGIFLADEGKVIPVTPLPDFDLEEQRLSMERLAALGCERTCFAHFGCGGAAADLARESLRNMELMVEAVRDAARREEDPATTASELMRIMEVNSAYGMFMFGGMSLQNVHGIRRYLSRGK